MDSIPGDSTVFYCILLYSTMVTMVFGTYNYSWILTHPHHYIPVAEKGLVYQATNGKRTSMELKFNQRMV